MVDSSFYSIFACEENSDNSKNKDYRRDSDKQPFQ